MWFVYYILQIAKSLPRICFFSGLSGEEMMMFIDAFPETGIEKFLPKVAVEVTWTLIIINQPKIFK